MRRRVKAFALLLMSVRELLPLADHPRVAAERECSLKLEQRVTISPREILVVDSVKRLAIDLSARFV